MKMILMRVLTGLQKQTRERQEGGDESLQLQHVTTRGQNISVVTFTLSIRVLLMFPPKARSSLGVGGLGPNRASPFFFSSSTLAAAGPLAFISFLQRHEQSCT